MKQNVFKDQILNKGWIITIIALLSLAGCGGGGGASDNVLQPQVDRIAPIIILNGSSEVMITVGTNFDDLGASASDNVDPSINVVSSGSVISSIPNIYTITYSASDSAGNKAEELVRTVKVVRKLDYAEYDGTWLKQCVGISSVEYPELYNLGTRSIFKRIVVALADDAGTPKRGFFTRLEAFSTSDCSGTRVFKGNIETFVEYLGEYSTSLCVGEKVEFDAFDGHFNLDAPDGAELYGKPEAILAFAKKIQFPYFNIICKDANGNLLTGKTTTERDGFSQTNRPTEFDQEAFLSN